MTQGTGKRLYRACLRCRRRKTKCDLESIGSPAKPPCVDCYRSGSECVLASSRRGGRVRRFTETGLTDSTELDAESAPRSADARPASIPAARDEEPSHEDPPSDDSDAEFPSQLRNPSDAVHFLAEGDGSARHAQHPSVSPNDPRRHSEAVAHEHTTTASRPTNAALAVDGYELVERGLLSAGTIQELLTIYKRRYHSYFPLAPSGLLAASALSRLERVDFFLLTVLLTIASRDRPDFSLTHRYCWDHCQRLLLDVLLAQPWTQSPRTVEALLLLSEWLPHIHSRPTAEQSESSLREDQTAWSLIGQAVRHAYLLKLDRAAFRGEGSRKSRTFMDHGRLIWTFLYLADRQISVRLGQSFWSRGPSLSSRFTAADFPMLKATDDDDEDFSQTHEANLQLTQMLHNAHDVLYSSRARTLALVFAGDYGRYIDDFQKAATAWHTAWVDVPRTNVVRRTLLLTYEYLGIFINAFSFQAVLTRYSSDRNKSLRKARATGQAVTPHRLPPFGPSVMASPDGRYIFDALSSARAVLTTMGSISLEELCTLPARYHLYGVYAAVFMYKAEQAGAITSNEDILEANELVTRFIAAMNATGSELHIARHYGTMLAKMWSRNSNSQVPGSYGQNDISHIHDSQHLGASQDTVASATSYPDRPQQQTFTAIDFQTPQLVDPDIGLLDTQMTFNPFLLDGTDMLGDPFDAMTMYPNDGPAAWW